MQWSGSIFHFDINVSTSVQEYSNNLPKAVFRSNFKSRDMIDTVSCSIIFKNMKKLTMKRILGENSMRQIHIGTSRQQHFYIFQLPVFNIFRL